MDHFEKRAAIGVVYVVAGYTLGAALWILLSDRAMTLLFSSPEALVSASTVKGWFFVGVTALLLYALLRRLTAALANAHRRELRFRRERQQPPPMLVAIADASSDAIFAKDEAGRYLLLNRAAASFIGKPAAQMLGQDDRAAFPPAQAEHIMAVDARVRATGLAETGVEVLQTAEGERTFLATKGPLYGSDGRVFGTYGISRDITHRHAAETELRLRNQELERFNRAATLRELRMVALKREVNDLARAAGRPEPYDLSFADACDATAAP